MRQVRLSVMAAALSVCAAVISAGCGGPPPKVRYYQLAASVEIERQGPAPLTLGVEYLSSDSAYEDARIVYRESPYRLDYYHYHRWTAPPALMVSDALRRALQQGGSFERVEAGYTSRANVLLRGRLVALEEVDVSGGEWRARLVLDLHAIDVATNRTIWSSTLERERAMPARTAESLAEALSEELAEVAQTVGPELVRAKQSFDAGSAR